MCLSSSAGTHQSRFSAYVEALGVALGYADRIASVRQHCAGLLMPGECQSIARSRPGSGPRSGSSDESIAEPPDRQG